MLSFLRYWLPVAVWMVVIFSASADSESTARTSRFLEPFLRWINPNITADAIDLIRLLVRKAAHMVEFGILALLTWRALYKPMRRDPRPWSWRAAGITMAIVVTYAAVDEFHQTFVPNRMGSPIDVLIDTIGGALALLVLWVWWRRRARNSASARAKGLAVKRSWCFRGRSLETPAMLNRNILIYGHEELPSRPLPLRAGPLTMVFEPETGFLRYVRLGDHEVVRCFYAVVRDQNWNTIAWQIANLKTDVRADSFEVRFDAECRERGVHYFWKGAFIGESNGRVTFTFDGEAKSEFMRNRIGICVLHPILECAGKPVTLEHNDGATEQTSFPKHIAPWQPLRDVRAITQEFAPGVRVELRFEGEVFETEDQRNYGDTSFKTYSTPQELPKPVAVNVGDQVHHRVTVSVLNPESKKVLPVVQGRGAQLSISTTPVVSKPALGVRMARQHQPLTEKEIERLRLLRLAHLRADVTFGGDWRAEWRAAVNESNQLGLPLQCALHLSANAESDLAELLREMESARPKVSLWIVYQQGHSMVPPAVVDSARQKLAPFGAQVLVAAGATPFFTEFNRNRPPADSSALVCFPFTPQVHLRDPLTVIENAADVAEMVESAKAITPQQVVVSPITLRPWHKVPRGADDLSSGQLPLDVDPRQMSLFAAAWTVAHLSRLAVSPHVHSATYFETAGWRGLMELESGSPLPEKFFSIPGGVFPVFHVFAALADFNRVLPTHSTHPLQVEALTLLDAQNRKRVLVANLWPEEQEVKIKSGTCEARVKRLHGETAEEAMRTPRQFLNADGESLQSVSGKLELKLGAYEVACVDIL